MILHGTAGSEAKVRGEEWLSLNPPAGFGGLVDE